MIIFLCLCVGAGGISVAVIRCFFGVFREGRRLGMFHIVVTTGTIIISYGYPKLMQKNSLLSSRPLTRRAFGTLAFTGLGLALAACGTSSSGSSTPSSSATAGAPVTLPDGMGTTAADGEFPRSVTHFRGESTIESQPTKVVVISTGQLDDILALGVVPVATATAKEADLVPSYLAEKYSDQADALNAMATVGTRSAPDVEAIANLSPDLILINNTNEDSALYDSLAALAPTVVTEGTGVNWKQDFLLCAAALGTTDKAAELMDTYNGRTDEVGSKIADELTFSFLRATADRTRIFGVASFIGSICEDSGLARPASQQVEKTSVDISAEQLDQADADWLFYGVQGGDTSTLQAEALWSSLNAVTSNQAVQVDDDMFFLNAGINAALGVLDLLEEQVAS